jgi:phosphoribosyl 1,2-cyclic phosphodiesterase
VGLIRKIRAPIGGAGRNVARFRCNVGAAVRVFVLSSGSSGNALLVEAAGTRIMIDAGIGPKQAAGRMRTLGRDLFPRGVDAIVLTHHHGDHIAHVEPLARAFRAPIYMHRGISAQRVRNRWEVREYSAPAPFRIGGLEVRAHFVPHDAPQVALSVASPDGERFGLATDLGYAPPSLTPFLAACDAALVEANYCPELLAIGPYPPRLRQRICGGLGHLANEQTAELAARLSGSRLSRLYLGHISRANNTPERALAVVAPRCVGLEVHAVPHGVPHVIDVVKSHRASAGFEQLALAFG